jgi:hypothetical protein
MVEFAMVASLLLLLLFAIVDFSRVFFSYATMAHGVREAARWGIIHPDDEAGIINLAESSMVVMGGEPVVEVGFPGAPDHEDEPGYPLCAHYCTVVVTATTALDIWTPVLPSINIETFSTMHIE